ncbi:MAG: hypothetical protein ACRCXT_10785 [Paraclostridium sp.]
MISFNDEPSGDLTPYNCTDYDSCFDELYLAIRILIGDTFPNPLPLNIEITDNNASGYNITNVYGLCNDILWVEFGSNVGQNRYGAIPLCYMFKFSVV